MRSVAAAGDFAVTNQLPAVLGHLGQVRLDAERKLGQLGSRLGVVVVLQENHRVRVQLDADELAGDVDHLFERQRSRQLARHFVQGLRALLANLRFPCLLLEAGGQLPDDQGGRQHHGEGHQILDVADGQRKARRHEKDVEQEDAQDGRQDGGAPPEADGDQQYREQEEHHDVGEIEMAEQRGGQQRGGGTGEQPSAGCAARG